MPAYDPAAPEHAEAGAKPFVGGKPDWRRARGVLVAAPVVAAGDAVADAAEPSFPRLLVRVERLRETAFQREIGVRDDAGDLRAGPVLGSAGHAGHPLCLANRSQVLGTVLAVAAAALGVHCLHDAVAGSGVRPQVGEQVSPPLVPFIDEVDVSGQTTT